MCQPNPTYACQRRQKVEEQQSWRGEASCSKNYEITELLGQLVHCHGDGCTEAGRPSCHPGEADTDPIHKVVDHFDNEVGNAHGLDLALNVVVVVVVTMTVATAAHLWDHQDTQSARNSSEAGSGHGIMVCAFQGMRQEMQQCIPDKDGAGKGKANVLQRSLDFRSAEESNENNTHKADETHAGCRGIGLQPSGLCASCTVLQCTVATMRVTVVVVIMMVVVMMIMMVFIMMVVFVMVVLIMVVLVVMLLTMFIMVLSMFIMMMFIMMMLIVMMFIVMMFIVMMCIVSMLIVVVLHVIIVMIMFVFTGNCPDNGLKQPWCCQSSSQCQHEGMAARHGPGVWPLGAAHT